MREFAPGSEDNGDDEDAAGAPRAADEAQADVVTKVSALLGYGRPKLVAS